MGELVETIVARLLAYTFDGDSIAALTASRVYIDQPPDNTSFPCLVIRSLNQRTAAQYNNTRKDFELEVMIYVKGRTAANARLAEQLGDLTEQALLTWVESSATLGLSFGREADRETVPPPQEPADRDIIGVRVLVQCATWPRYLTDALV
jgi:hypothetical protein